MDQKISADTLVSVLDGSEYLPIVQAGGNVRILVTTIIALASSGQEITNATNITRLKTAANWDAPVGGNYTGPALSGETEHKYYVGTSTDGPVYKYVLLKVATVLKPVRILVTPY